MQTEEVRITYTSLAMKSMFCRFCGRTLTENESEWHQAWGTGTCPSCGRYYNPSLETQVEVLSQDPGIIHRARNKRISTIAGGLLLIALTFLLHHLGVKPSHLATLIITGVVLAISGAFYSARHQARTELTENDRAERPE
jgi:hypothetical protein